VNQVEFHPYLQQNKLRQYLAEHDVLTCAYSPLMPLTTKKEGPLTAVIEKIAKKQGRTEAQVFVSDTVLMTGFVEMVVAKGSDSHHHECERSTSKGATQFQHPSMDSFQRGNGGN
jgi:diketogulonate reductase-like aldo/keto reductase